jgi:hypothetical protein
MRPREMERTITMRVNWIVVAVLASMGAVGCGAAAEGSEEESGAAAASLATAEDGYVTLRPAASGSPGCGGYLVKDAAGGAEAAVAGLDFDGSGIDPATERAARSAPAEELILRGHLGPIEPAGGARRFVVREVYRGMPGVRAGAADALFTTEPRSGDCRGAACAIGAATRIGEASARPFHAVDVERAALPWVDRVWLADRAAGHRAIVAASIVERGGDRTLDAGQVFVRLPDAIGPCEARAEDRCGEGSVLAFARTADRCVQAPRCVKAKFCTMYLPTCSEGYSLQGWVGESGCPAYACDPSFVVRPSGG